MPLSMSKLKNLLDNSRPGDVVHADGTVTTDDWLPQVVKGLQLSEILFKPLEWFKYNPDNALFRECKTEEYFTGLEKDIREANAVINPVVATQEGLLIEGESRHIVASRLCGKGLKQFGRIPCRVVLSKISRAGIKERLYLGNLSRFDIPREVKLLAYAEIWPDYFLAKSDGREGNAVTTRKEVAAATGVSESQIKRDKAVIRKAAQIAEEEKAPLRAKHIKEAQKNSRGGGAHDAPLPPEAAWQPGDTGSIKKQEFLRAGVLLLFRKSEFTAVTLLVDHFLRKKEKEDFLKSLPGEVKTFLTGKK